MSEWSKIFSNKSLRRSEAADFADQNTNSQTVWIRALSILIVDSANCSCGLADSSPLKSLPASK